MNTFIDIKLTTKVLSKIDQLIQQKHNQLLSQEVQELYGTRELLLRELIRLCKQLSVDSVDKAIKACQ